MPTRLNTRQINALRTLLELRDFTAADVARLDYQRVVRTPGVGAKSVLAIRDWLGEHGSDLRNSPPRTAPRALQGAQKRRIEAAIRLLESHGYAVVRPDTGEPAETPAPSARKRRRSRTPAARLEPRVSPLADTIG